MAGFYYGAWTQARTGDPRFFRAMLYQLSYPGKKSSPAPKPKELQEYHFPLDPPNQLLNWLKKPFMALVELATCCWVCWTDWYVFSA